MLLGGVLTDGLGWEWVLWVNVPVSLIAFALAPRLIAESRDEQETRAFDVAGAVTVTAALSVLVYTVVDATECRLGIDQDARPDRDSPSSCSPPSSRSSCARASRWCRSRSSASAR